MKVTTDRRSLLSAAGGAAEAVARRTTKEVLRCLRVTGTVEGKLLVEATDTETGVRLEVAGAGVQTAGACLIPAAKLTEWLKATRDGDLSISRGEAGLTIKAGRARFDQPWLDVREFPDPIPELAGGRATVETTAAAFLAAWNRVAFCRERASTTAFQTTGVAIEVGGGSAVLMATDTKRCGACELDGAAVTADKPVAATLPANTGKLLASLAAGEEPLSLTLGTTGLVASAGRGAVYTRLLEGQPAPWRKIMAHLRDKNEFSKFPVDPADLAAAVRQAAVTCDAETRRVDVALRPGAAVLTSRATDGAGEVGLDLPGYAGPELAVAVDPAHLLDHLDALGAADRLDVEVAGDGKPVFLSCETCPGWRYFFVSLAT